MRASAVIDGHLVRVAGRVEAEGMPTVVKADRGSTVVAAGITLRVGYEDV